MIKFDRSTVPVELKQMLATLDITFTRHGHPVLP